MNSTDANPSSRPAQWVEILFDCLPLRAISRTDAPLDASPKLVAKMSRIKAAIEKHGTLNSYYLHNASCTFHLTNDPLEGMIQFTFEGVVLTDIKDLESKSTDLQVELDKETCSWINQSIVQWFRETVPRAVLVEFDRYIKAGDLSQAIQRMERIQKASDEAGGFVGMYL